MKTPRALGNLYGGLTPQERFALVLAADAREDQTEAERLIRSCRKTTYTANDVAFTARCEASELLAMAVWADTAKMLGWLGQFSAAAPTPPPARRSPRPARTAAPAGPRG